MKKGTSLERRRKLSGYVFILPWLLGFPVLMLYPLFSNLLMSFGKTTGISGLNIQLTGFQNYIRLFTENTQFIPALIDTVKITFLWTPFIIVFALFLAILLNRKIALTGLFRVIFFLPVLLGTGYIMQQLGPAANILALPDQAKDMMTGYLGEGLAQFMSELLAQIMRVFWRSGVQIVIFLAGLQGIPESYYEAARVEGANGWECFWKITLPMISPMILLNTVYTVIETFRDTENKIAALVVKIIFDDTNYEYGAAMGWIYFAVTFLIIGLIFLASRRFVRYER